MHFVWLNKQGVRSNTGFELQTTGRFTMEYRENNKIITLDIESGILGASTPAILMSREAIQCWDDGTTVEFQDEVLSNIQEALAFQGLALSIE